VSPGLRRVGAAVAALAVLGSGFAMLLVPEPRNETPHSVDNAGPHGWHAAFVLLQELGLSPRAWEQPPGLLPSGRQLVWLPCVPIDPREDEEVVDASSEPRAQPDALDLAREVSRRSPRHLRGFLEQGGLLAAALSPEMLEFLRADVGLHELEGAELEELDPAPGRVRLPSGEQLELELESASRLTGLDGSVERNVLASTLRAETVAIELPVGRGALVLLASDAILDNSALRSVDQALFLVRLLEALAPQSVLFDEHALGLWSEAGTLDLALSPRLRLLTLHLVITALLAAWSLSFAREFPRDPEPLLATAPLERARGISSLALRAGRPGVLGRELVRGTLQGIGQRLRTPLPESESARRWLERLCEAAGLPRAGDPIETWDAKLLRAHVRTREDLARLDAGLRNLELELCGTTKIPDARRPAAAPSPNA
jgi:hypothetical protein